MITADTNHGDGFLLMDDRNEPIAVITPRANQEGVDITNNINEALRHHYGVKMTVPTSEEVHFDRYSDIKDFYVQTGDKEDDVRPFRMKSIILYMA